MYVILMKHIYYFYFFKHNKKIKFLFLLDIIFFLTKSYAKNNILLKKCIKYYSFINNLFILEKNKKVKKKELIKKLNNEIKKINFVNKYHNFSSKSEKLFFYNQIGKRKKQINNIEKNKEEEYKDNKLKTFIKKKNFFLSLKKKLLELISKIKISNNTDYKIKETKKKYILKYIIILYNKLNNKIKRTIIEINKRKKELILFKYLKHKKLKKTRKLVKKLALLFTIRLKSIGQFFFNQVPTILIHEKSRKKVGVLFNRCFKYIFKTMNERYSKYSFFYIFIKHLKKRINPYLNEYSLMYSNNLLLEIVSFFFFNTSNKSINNLLKKEILNNKKPVNNNLNINFIYKFVYKYYFRLDFFLKKFFSDIDMLRYNISSKGILINGFLVKDYTIYLKLNDLINLNPISKFANFNKYYNNLIININSLFFFINNNCHYPFFKIKKWIYNALFLVLKRYIKYKKTNYYVKGKLIYFTNKEFILKRNILKYLNISIKQKSSALLDDKLFLKTKYIPSYIGSRYYKNKDTYFFNNLDRYGDYMRLSVNRKLKKKNKYDLYEDANIVRDSNINDTTDNRENLKYKNKIYLNRFGFSARKIHFSKDKKENSCYFDYLLKYYSERNRMEHFFHKNYYFFYNFKFNFTNLLRTSLFYNINKLRSPIEVGNRYYKKSKKPKGSILMYKRKKLNDSIIYLLSSKKSINNNFQKNKPNSLKNLNFYKLNNIIKNNISTIKLFTKGEILYNKISRNSIYEEFDHFSSKHLRQENFKLNRINSYNNDNLLLNNRFKNNNYNKFNEQFNRKLNIKPNGKFSRKSNRKFNKKKLHYNNFLFKRQRNKFY